MTIKKALAIALLFSATAVFAQSTSGLSSNVAVINRTVPSGWSLTSLPVIPASTAIGQVMAENNGTGNQLNGGTSATTSDQVWNENGQFGWYYSGTPGSGWYGSLSQVSNNEGYWIYNRSVSSRNVLLIGTVPTTSQTQNVPGGNTWSLVGVPFPKNFNLSDATNGLVASGFAGGGTANTSSQIWDDQGHFAWYYNGSLGGSAAWFGSLTQLQEGHAYFILNRGATFIWTVNPPTSY